MSQESGNRLAGLVRRVRRQAARRAMIAVLVSAALIPGLSAAEATGAGLELLRLVPDRACMVLTIDDVRGQYRELMASRLIADLRALPPVKAWFESDKYRQLEAARDQIEDALDVSLTDVRDQILGDAVVFALEVPADSSNRPDAARGLLLVKAADPKLLERLIESLNSIQKTNGEVLSVEEQSHRGKTYFVRKFPEGSDRRIDAYVTFPDGRFAISNSAESIQQVIDRASAGGGGASQGATGPTLAERFRATQKRLPERALARLLVDPGTVSRLLQQESGESSPGNPLLIKHLNSLASAGAALVLGDDRITLQGVEVFKPGIRGEDRGVAGEPAASAAFDRLPDATLGVASLRANPPALYRAVAALVPEKDRPRLESLELVLKGILLGQDFRTAILPSLGPRIGAILLEPRDWKPAPEENSSVVPGAGFPFPFVLTVELNERAAPQVTAALDNALTTLLAVISLDERHRSTVFRVVTRDFQGHAIRTLDPSVPFAFTIDPRGRQIILANSEDALRRLLAATPDSAATARWKSLAARGFPGAGSFLCLDMAAVQAMIHTQRDRMADQIAGREHRPKSEVARDLENVEALAEVFDAAFWTHRVDHQSAATFHTLGLLLRPARRAEGTPPTP